MSSQQSQQKPPTQPLQERQEQQAAGGEEPEKLEHVQFRPSPTQCPRQGTWELARLLTLLQKQPGQLRAHRQRQLQPQQQAEASGPSPESQFRE